MASDTGDRLLTPAEVSAVFRVDPKTVTRWAAAGRLGSIRTPGGHRRFRESEVRALLEGNGAADDAGSFIPPRPLPFLARPGRPAGPPTSAAPDAATHPAGPDQPATH